MPLQSLRGFMEKDYISVEIYVKGDIECLSLLNY